MSTPPLTTAAPRWPQLVGAATTWRAALRAGLAATYAALRSAHDAAHGVAAPVKQTVEAGAVAVAETAAKAAAAPAEVAREVRREVDEWWTRTSAAMAEGLVLAALGILALIVLTVGVVALLNDALGDPHGTLAVAAIDILVLVALLARRKARAGPRHAEP